MSEPHVPCEVVGSGMLARAFARPAVSGPPAVICASGVADSACVDPSAFRRELDLLRDLGRRARASDSVLVYFSGAPVYGHARGIRTEADLVAPETPYGRHQLACEQLVSSTGARYLVLRLPNIVGPQGNPSQLIPSLVAQAVRGSMTIRKGATRDLLDVEDLVGIVRALLRHGVVDSLLNVASGISTPVRQIAETIEAALEVSPTIVFVDGGDQQVFSIAAARDACPDYPRFDRDYPLEVLMRRVPSIARVLREGISS